jgi:transcriptional regulator with XRE-family HTH domain
MQPRTDTQTFRSLLRWHRTNAGLTQEELAERAGLSRRGIADLERGARRAPYAHTVECLARALGLPAADHAALIEAGRHLRTPATRPAALPETGRPQLRVLNGTADDLEAGADAQPRHNLPLQPTSFVGREREQVRLATVLASSPLVTLVIWREPPRTAGSLPRPVQSSIAR